MKLFFCPTCRDVQAMRREGGRTCACGSSGGYYQSDGLVGVVTGQAIPLGISNSSLGEAIENRPDSGDGRIFLGFVIPYECETVIESTRK